jgi:hypothetical protein
VARKGVGPKRGHGRATLITAEKIDPIRRLSHDLRNELGGIALVAHHLSGNVTGDDFGRKVFKSATDIRQMALRMGQLLEELMDVVQFRADLRADLANGAQESAHFDRLRQV